MSCRAVAAIESTTTNDGDVDCADSDCVGNDSCAGAPDVGDRVLPLLALVLAALAVHTLRRMSRT